MNLNWFYGLYQENPGYAGPIFCLRNHHGTLLSGPGPTFNWAKCDVCGDRYAYEVLESILRSTWEALRLGYQPLESRASGDIRMSVSFQDHTTLFHEQRVTHR